MASKGDAPVSACMRHTGPRYAGPSSTGTDRCGPSVEAFYVVRPPMSSPLLLLARCLSAPASWLSALHTPRVRLRQRRRARSCGTMTRNTHMPPYDVVDPEVSEVEGCS